MEQIAPAETSSSWWRSGWLAFGLAALLIVALLIDRQLVGWVFAGLGAAPLTWVAVPALFLLPGLAVLRWVWPGTLPLAERWSLAIGISAALPPLILLLSEPIGLRWNTWLAWLYLLLAAIALLWPARGTRQLDIHDRLRAWRPDTESALLLAMLLAALVARLYAARGLPVGLWGDSYHHTIIAQLLIDHGGLFASWEPYAALQTFTYHYGFHSLVAWLSWLTGEPPTRGLLVIGQVESALTIPVVYLLTRRVIGSGPAALWAALIAGFVSAMPAYYLNWGRYTQLAGQTILPAACVIWMALMETAVDAEIRRGRLVRLGALAVLIMAGLALTHYRVAVFTACFVAAFGIYLLIARVRSPRALAWLAGTALTAAVLVALGIASWLLRLREGALLKIGNSMLTANIGAEQSNGLPTPEVIFGLLAKGYLIGLALLGVVLLIGGRQWRGLVVVGWALLVTLAANPYLIGLNGAGILTNFAVVIASYLMLAPLGGAALAIGSAWLMRQTRVPQLVERGLVVAGTLVVLWSFGWQQRIADMQFQLFAPADQQAMDWIRSQTPADAAFFVNSFTAYSGTLYAGSDAGWWLSFMSGRRSSLPPMTYGSEAGEQPDYLARVNATNAAIERNPVTSPEAVAALRAAGYRYLYDGPAAAGLPPGQAEYINRTALARSPFYELAYDQGGVTIWRLR
jgi:hypothetical protein